jgi:hypothetical protein
MAGKRPLDLSAFTVMVESYCKPNMRVGIMSVCMPPFSVACSQIVMAGDKVDIVLSLRPLGCEIVVVPTEDVPPPPPVKRKRNPKKKASE